MKDAFFNIISNLFYKLFSKKIPKIYPNLPTITGGSKCPNCKEDAIFSHPFLKMIGLIPQPYKYIYICENCFKEYSNIEYSNFITIQQRKDKLKKLTTISD